MAEKNLSENVHAEFTLALQLFQQQQWPHAAKICRNILKQDKTHAGAISVLAIICQNQAKFKTALKLFSLAVHLEPDNAVFRYNLDHATATLTLKGNLYCDDNQAEKALSCYRQVLQYQTSASAADHSRYAVTLLKLGHYTEGWQEYEWRLKTPTFAFLQPALNIPRWNGEPLQGKTLRIHAEQGFGDTIQFLRFIPLIPKQQGKIIFEAPQPILELAASIHEIDYLVPRGKPCPDADHSIPLLSLAQVFNTTLETIPAKIPYLWANENKLGKWRHLIVGDQFKIGFAWGGQLIPNDRSCPLEKFLSLAANTTATFYSFQLDERKKQLKQATESHSIIDVSDHIENFADTAAAISYVDLVISIDTALAHVAGALGKPIWNLNTFACDWRWQAHETHTPWYPSMRLFHQPTLGDWDSVFAELHKELKNIGRAKQ